MRSGFEPRVILHYERHSVRIDHQFYNGEIRIRAYHGDVLTGYVNFMQDGDTLWSAGTQVFPDYRGLKLAASMYLYAYNLGYMIRPSQLLSKDGAAMWKAFRKAKMPFIRVPWYKRLWTASVKLIG